MDWVEYDAPPKPAAVNGRKEWLSKWVDIEQGPYDTHLLIEFACTPDEFLSDYQTSIIVVQWEHENGINMNTTLVEVLGCRRCTVPKPVVELWCKMTKIHACIRFDASA